MRQPYFYTHLIELDNLEDRLTCFGLEESHHRELLQIAYRTIHAEVMHFTISELPDKHKREFLKQFSKRPQDKGLLVFLKNSLDDFEDKVKNIAYEVEQKLIYELHEYENASLEWFSDE